MVPFLVDSPALLVCFESDNISRTQYLNDSYVPKGLKIFDINSKGTYRIIDSTEFKRRRN